MPPWTSTKLSCNFSRVAIETSSSENTSCFGNRRPRLTPNSGSFSVALEPRISLIPGQTPPESCQPPPDPPIHSPKIARAAITRRSFSSSAPSSEATCPVARISIEINEPSKLVETARREPLGMSLTLLTISSPSPGPTILRISVSIL